MLNSLPSEMQPDSFVRHAIMVAAFLLLATGTYSFLETHLQAADPAAENEKKTPVVKMCSPLAVPTGATTKVIVRGWNLNEVTEARSTSPHLTFKVLAAATATIPNKQDAKQIGDTQVELEIIVAKNAQPSDIEFTVVNSDGESSAHSLPVGSTHPSTTEKEANDGFRQAQSILVPQVVEGQIHADQNVDVFSFDLVDKQQVNIEVIAQRRGSNLDSVLTLFDSRGNIIAVNDDHKAMSDSLVSLELDPGSYFISLQDAHDRGGPAHPYRLVLTGSP